MEARELSVPKASSRAGKVYQLRLRALQKEPYPCSGPKLVPGAGRCACRAQGARTTGLAVTLSPARIPATQII